MSNIDTIGSFDESPPSPHSTPESSPPSSEPGVESPDDSEDESPRGTEPVATPSAPRSADARRVTSHKASDTNRSVISKPSVTVDIGSLSQTKGKGAVSPRVVEESSRSLTTTRNLKSTTPAVMNAVAEVEAATSSALKKELLVWKGEVRVLKGKVQQLEHENKRFVFT